MCACECVHLSLCALCIIHCRSDGYNHSVNRVLLSFCELLLRDELLLFLRLGIHLILLLLNTFTHHCCCTAHCFSCIKMNEITHITSFILDLIISYVHLFYEMRFRGSHNVCPPLGKKLGAVTQIWNLGENICRMVYL